MGGLPLAMRIAGGRSLYFVQLGEDPPDWKPMETVGAGTREIRVSDHSGWYRIFYVAKLGDMIYVLHVIEKETRKTPQPDIEIARDRYRQALKCSAAHAKKGNAT